jgi:hypothetical protein
MLYVDNERMPYIVHKELLTHHSPYFRTILSGNSQDARSNIVRTDKSLYWAPELVIHWLYRERFPNKHDDPDFHHVWTTSPWHVVEVCIFCHLYDIPVLKRKALDHLYKMFEEKGIPMYSQFCYAFEYLPLGSPLCRFLVDLHCEKAEEMHWAALSSQTPFQDREQLVLRRFSQMSRLGQQARGALDLCDYHEHASDEERQACAAERAA